MGQTKMSPKNRSARQIFFEVSQKMFLWMQTTWCKWFRGWDNFYALGTAVRNFRKKKSQNFTTERTPHSVNVKWMQKYLYDCGPAGHISQKLAYETCMVDGLGCLQPFAKIVFSANNFVVHSRTIDCFSKWFCINNAPPLHWVCNRLLLGKFRGSTRVFSKRKENCCESFRLKHVGGSERTFLQAVGRPFSGKRVSWS